MISVLSVTQPDIAVVRGNLLGWLLVWRQVSPNQIFLHDLSRRETRMRQW